MVRAWQSVRIAVIFTAWFGILESSHAVTIVDFDDVQLPVESAFPATAADQSAIVRHGVVFNRSWNSQYGCCPSGWALSNQTERLAAGLAGTYSAFVPSDAVGNAAGNQFAVGNNLQRGESRILFPQPTLVQGMHVANVTYAYLATVQGDDGAGFVKGPFQTGDWFRLDVVGMDASGGETGREPIFLVDYRDGNLAALQDWTWFDLTSLGNQVASLEFEMTSSDLGDFGMNTPAYFAIDDLTIGSVPEPSGLSLAVLALGIGAAGRCRRR